MYRVLVWIHTTSTQIIPSDQDIIVCLLCLLITRERDTQHYYGKIVGLELEVVPYYTRISVRKCRINNVNQREEYWTLKYKIK